MPNWHTPKSVAEMLGIDQGKVLAWIHTGQLIAVNVAESLTSRPRWRIADSEVDAFLNRRKTQPPQPVKRQRKSTGVIEFY